MFKMIRQWGIFLICSHTWFCDGTKGSSADASGCDFPVLNSAEGSAANQFDAVRGSGPALLRGFMDSWPSQKWTMDSFLGRYGDISVKAGSESSIVLSHGRATEKIKIKEFIDIISENGISSELFVFDTDAIAAMTNEPSTIYERPSVLSNFSGGCGQDRSTMQVFSMGGGDAGLSFHVHGEAWLGVLNMHGPEVGKRWLVVPPGYHYGAAQQRRMNPYSPVWKQVSGILAGEHSGPHTAHRDDNVDVEVDIGDERYNTSVYIMHCMQRPGDIVYVPSGWAHLTLNSGPVVGIGEQKVWLAEDRERFCRSILRLHPLDYDCLKGLAIALLSRIKDNAVGDPRAQQEAKDEVLHNLRLAISVRPQYPECRLLLVEALLESVDEAARTQGLAAATSAEDTLDNIKASEHIRSEISGKGIAASFYRLGKVLAMKKYNDDAIRLLEKAYDLDSSSVTALGHLALLHHEAGNTAALRTVLDAMDAVTPGHPMVARMRATVARAEELSNFKYSKNVA